MSLNTKISNIGVNAQADAICALANNGYLRLFNGTQPTDADTAIGAQVQLAELRFGSTAFGASVAGVATANAITSDTDADNTGTASWFRIYKSDGTTVLWDGSIGTSGANLNLNSVSIVQHAQVDCTGFTFTAQKS